MKKTFTRLFMLVLLTMMSGWASAESVTFNVRSWDDTNKKVVTTSTTHDCTPIEGQNWSWMALGENGKETWYMVKGTDVTRKVLVIFGTVHLVLPDNSKLTCNHIKLEANNNAVLHVHDQGSTSPGTLNVINYGPDGKREYKNAAAIGSGGGENNNSGSLYVHGGNIVAEQVRTIEGIFSTGSNAAAIGGGKYGGIDPNHRVVVYDGSVNAQGGYEGAGIGGGYKGHQGGPVIIYGGRVEAKTSVRGAGIGGGCDRNGGRVEIYGGTVIARSNSRSAGIGGGEDGHGGDVHIYGGDVKAYGSTRGAGIGGSGEGNGGTCEIAGGTVYAKSGRDKDVRYVCPAIGGGSKGNGGTVKITGGTVIVENDWIIKNKAPLALIGGSLNLNPGSVEIAPGMKVSCNKNQGQLTLVNSADKRVKALRNESNVYGRIESCDHQGTEATYKQVDDNQHSVVCKVCGYEGKENHKYTDGKCACGKEEKKEPAVYTITIHKTTDGKTYTSEEQKVVQGQEFMLPVPQSPSGLTFMGYLKATSADGIEMKDSEEENLLEGGSTITPDANATYYARYRYIYDEEWTWNDDCTAATVKITNALLNDTHTLTAAEITEDTEQRMEPTETSLGERYFTAKASYTHSTGITYPFYGHVTLMYYPDTNAEITLDAQSKNNANAEALENYIDMKADVTINNLTLKKDGKIHPICLPFSVSTGDDTPLKGAVIYKLSGAQLKDHEFTMTFKQGLTTEPGIPCFYRFKETGADVQNPEFKNVVIEEYYGLIAEKEYDASTWSADDESLELWGTFEPESIDEENRELYFLMDGDGISLKPTTLNAFGSYFYIANPTDEQGNSRVRSVSLAFESGYNFSKKLTWSWDGDGSEAKPYIIKNAEQLSEMSEAMNGTDAAALEGKYFRQDAKITFDKATENNYTPVKTLKAHYDGNGFVISGLNINAAGADNAALFLNMADGSTVKNVIVRNSTITGSQAAAIATTITGTASVENCHVLKDVEVRSNYYYAGGVVAQMQSGTPTVTDCSSQAAVISNQGYAGGVVGWVTNGSVSNSIYLGNSITHGDGKQSYAVAGGNAGITVENCYYTCPTLSDANAKLMPQYNADNTDFLMMVNLRDKYLKTGKTDLADADISYDITLNGHTLYKDGTWNTLCLPFSVDNFSGTPLADATVKQLTKSNYWQDNKLELIFNTVDRATGGYLYFVKWTGGDDVTSPTFSGVVIDPNSASPHADYVDQYGTFKPVTLEADDKTVLYLGADNKLYYPKSAVTINSFHGYLKLQSNLVMGDLAGVRSIELNFGDDTTGLEELKNGRMEEWKTSDSWYTLDGKKLQGQPTKKGVFIVNGRKVVIK